MPTPLNPLPIPPDVGTGIITDGPFEEWWDDIKAAHDADDEILGDLFEVLGEPGDADSAKIKLADGTSLAPAIYFAENPGTGIFRDADNTIKHIHAGNFAFGTEATRIHAYVPLRIPDGTAGSPAIVFTQDLNTGIIRVADDALGIVTGGVVRCKVEHDPAADATALIVWDSSAGALKRVYRGAADSGGTGYRALRVLN